MYIRSIADRETYYRFNESRFRIIRNEDTEVMDLEDVPAFAEKFRPDIKKEILRLYNMQMEMNEKARYRVDGNNFDSFAVKAMLSKHCVISYGTIQTMIINGDLII